MPLPPVAANFLKHYLMIRWRCEAHGWFETGTLIFQHSADCPICGTPALYVEHCEGMTTRQLPFFTKLRDSAHGEDNFAIDPSRKPSRPSGL